MMMLTNSALRRRVKRAFNRGRHDLFIPCAPGLESILHAEVVRALANDDVQAAISPGRGGVAVNSHVHAIYPLNNQLRVANRVLLRITDFWADSLPAAYGHAKQQPWETCLGFHEKIRIRSSSKKSRIGTGHGLEESIVAAVNDRFTGLRPPVRIAEHDADVPSLFVRVANDRVTISIDTTGEHLFKRGYRVAPGKAPLRPTLAAAMVIASGWTSAVPLVDPFCGSGTIPIEAALISAGREPGAFRKFAFETLPFHNPSLWARLRRQGYTTGSSAPRRKIFGSDVDARVIQLAKEHVNRAQVQEHVQLAVADALSLQASEIAAADRAGVLVSNLPYGRRIAVEGHADTFVKKYMKQARSHFPGWGLTVALPASAKGLEDEVSIQNIVHTTNGGLPIQIVTGILRKPQMNNYART